MQEGCLKGQVYSIRRLPEGCGCYPLDGVFHPERLPAPWSELEEAALREFPWDENGYRPDTRARVGWNEQGLHVLMYANEAAIRAEVHHFGGRVCDDSCMEFFVQCTPQQSQVYVNLECGPHPAMLLSVGTDRYNRRDETEAPDGLCLQASIHEGGWWAVSYTVPMAFLQCVFGQVLSQGQHLRGNFFICGDQTAMPHFGMWHGTDTTLFPKPDFHQPSMFGDMVLA